MGALAENWRSSGKGHKHRKGKETHDDQVVYLQRGSVLRQDVGMNRDDGVRKRVSQFILDG